MGKVLNKKNDRDSASLAWLSGISKILMAPSGAPQTATWPRPSTPHADDRTTMPAFVSSRLITAGGVPPPVHCTEPRDLNTILLAGGFASLPQAARALKTRRSSKRFGVTLVRCLRKPST